MSEPIHPEVVILNTALELSSEERIAYLEQACADDPTLRKRVEALIRAYENAGEFLESSPSSFLERTVRVPFPIAEKPGDRIGQYKLLQQIGEGGCGVVYMAEQVEPVRRRVALKIIKLGMDTKQVIARFEAERQALALMDHPNIAMVLDAGSTETGRPYFVMELVRGIKITEFCDQNELSTPVRLKLFIQVCQAIQHAHQKGVIHRDIKPSNVIVTINDGVPVPKVIDFGIAKATAGRLTDLTLFTAFEQFIGTPAYMSPEQAVMTSLDIDTRSDIYSLGVMLYELLTGSTPFGQEELLAVGLDEMRRTIREKEPPRPSMRLSTMAVAALTTTAKHRHTEVPKLIHLLRGDLDWIVMKCLEKDRRRRYETANGLAMDVRRHLESEPVVARPPSSVYRLGRLVRRNRLVFVASSAVATALIIGLGVSTWQFSEKSRALQRATEAEQAQIQLRQQAEGEARKSDQVARFSKELLERVVPSAAMGRDTAMLREILDKTRRSIDEDLSEQEAVGADLLGILGKVYLDLGAYDDAQGLLERALTIRTKLYGTNLDVARSLSALGESYRKQGKVAEAEVYFQKALDLRIRLLGDEHLEVANSLFDFGLLYHSQGDGARAEQYFRQAMVMRQKLLGDDHPEAMRMSDMLGLALSNQGRYAEAEHLQREALELAKSLKEGELSVARCMHNLAFTLREEGKSQEAERLFGEASAVRRKLLGSHPDTADTLVNFAELRRRQGAYSEAESLAEECLAMREELFGKDHPSTASPRYVLGQVMHDQGRFAEAESFYRESLTIRTRPPSYIYPQFTALLENLCAVLRKQGKEAAIEDMYGQLLGLMREHRSPHDPEVAEVLASYATFMLAQKRFADAEKVARECLSILEARNPDAWSTFEARSQLGSCLLGQKHYAPAEPLLLSGYEGMKQHSGEVPLSIRQIRLEEALQRLVQLYQALDDQDRATLWRQRLEGFQPAGN